MAPTEEELKLAENSYKQLEDFDIAQKTFKLWTNELTSRLGGYLSQVGEKVSKAEKLSEKFRIAREEMETPLESPESRFPNILFSYWEVESFEEKDVSGSSKPLQTYVFKGRYSVLKLQINEAQLTTLRTVQCAHDQQEDTFFIEIEIRTQEGQEGYEYLRNYMQELLNLQEKQKEERTK